MSAIIKGSLILLALAACAPQRETRSNSSSVSTSVAAASPVRIDSVRPATVDLMGPGLAELKIYGQGFVADSNDVRLDSASVAKAGSVDGAYIRIVLSKTLPSAGGPPMTMMAGNHVLEVRNARGSSNSVQLKVQ
jgi:hypothetical protein